VRREWRHAFYMPLAMKRDGLLLDISRPLPYLKKQTVFRT
jgi:hypothetical protein